jgi:hypothetical protein
MKQKRHRVQGYWRIIETEMWDADALDLVVPAHITLGPDGLGELEMIAIGASVDYRVEQNAGGMTTLEFSWSGFDEMDPCCGRGKATIEGDTMKGVVFIHDGDRTSFVAKRDV